MGQCRISKKHPSAAQSQVTTANALDLAQRIAREVITTDRAAAALGIELVDAAPGSARLALTVRPEHTQGHGTCHGGVLFTLADTAFAVACNSHNDRAVAQHCAISYLSPGEVGHRLVAEGVERSRCGRSGLYDVTIRRDDGKTIAEFRGHSRLIGGHWFPVAPSR